MADRADLQVKIGIDQRELTAGLRDAAKTAKAAGQEMQSSLGGAGANVSGAMTKMATAAKAAFLGIVAGAAAVSAVLVKLTLDALETADGLVRMSDQTGFTIEALQKFRYAANQAGVSTEELDAGMKGFVARMGEASFGTSETAKALSALGVQLRDAEGLRSTEAVFLDIVEALERIEDPAKRAAAAADVFGKGAGGSLATLASQGAGSVRELMKEAERLGIVMGGDLVRQGDAAGDAIDRLKTVITAGLNQALLQSAPQIEAFISELLADPEQIQRLIGQLVEGAQKIASVGAAAATAVVFVADFFNKIGKGLAILAAGAEAAPLEGQIQDLTKELKALDAEMSEAAAANQADRMAELQHQYLQTEMALAKLVKTQGEWMGLGAGTPETPAAEGGTGGGGPPIDYTPVDSAAQDRRDKEVAAEAKKNQQIIAATMERLKTEQQIEDERHAGALAALQALSDEEVSQFGGRAKAKEDIERAHSDAILKIRNDAAAADIAQAVQEAANVDLKKQQLSDLLLSLQDAQSQELLLEQEQYAARLAALDQFRADGLEIEGGYDAAREAMIADHEKRVHDTRASYLQSGLEFLKYIENDKLRAGADGFAKNIQAMGTQSKKMFEISKALAIANTVVNTAQAAMGAYSAMASIPYIGPVLGAAAALAAVGAGLAQIQTIKNSKFGGGTTAAIPGAAAPGGGSIGADGTVPGQGGGGGGSQINLSIAPGIYTDQDMRRLAESLQSAYRDGAPGG